MTRRIRLLTAVTLTAALLLGLGCGSGGGDGATAPPTNDPPTLSLSADSGMTVLISGDPVALVASAVDPDGDALSYVWRTIPTGWGSFSDSTASAPTWTVGAERGLVSLQCEASDGVNAPVLRQITQLEVGTAVAATTLDADLSWTAAESPYVLLGDLTISPGATLNIEPGVQVYLRPAVAGPGSWNRHAIFVRGRLEALGTGSSVSTSIRFRGGRESFPDPTQHQGILFTGSGSGLLQQLTVRDGDVGVSQLGNGVVSLVDCRIQSNGVGITTGGGSAITVRHSRISDNGAGILVNTGSLTLRASRIRDHTGPGVSVNGISLGATADVDSCEFRDNGGGHLQVDTSGGFVTATVATSNLLRIVDGTASVKFVTALCSRVDSELRSNYWGQGIDTGADLLGLFDGRKDCGMGVSGWTVGLDWRQSAHTLDLP
jgi:Right handed beta helix region